MRSYWPQKCRHHPAPRDTHRLLPRTLPFIPCHVCRLCARLRSVIILNKPGAKRRRRGDTGSAPGSAGLAASCHQELVQGRRASERCLVLSDWVKTPGRSAASPTGMTRLQTNTGKGPRPTRASGGSRTGGHSNSTRPAGTNRGPPRPGDANSEGPGPLG